jgi:hypothetical protein
MESILGPKITLDILEKRNIILPTPDLKPQTVKKVDKLLQQLSYPGIGH